MRDRPEPLAPQRRQVSACIITRNEAAHIVECIRSVAFCDEVLVVDSCSSDATRQLAVAAGARVIEQEFLGHVRQKQLAIEAAAHDWVLCVDADERVSPELAAAVQGALAADAAGCAGFEVARHTFYLGRFIDHGGWWPEWRLRLFDRRRGRWGGTDPHDHVLIDGAARRLAGELVHFNYRDLSHHAAKIDSYSSIIAARRMAAGERFALHKLILRPPARFVRMYLLKGGFRDGVRGFLVAWMGAYYVFMKYAKLWECEHVAQRDDALR